MLRRGDRIAQVHRSAAFADVVPVPGGTLHYYISSDHRLASQPRVQCKVGGLINPVRLIILHLAQVFLALFHNDVARSAGAIPATGVLELQSMIDADVQQRTRLAVARVRHSGGVPLKGHIVREDCQSRHVAIIASAAGSHLGKHHYLDRECVLYWFPAWTPEHGPWLRPFLTES